MSTYKVDDIVRIKECGIQYLEEMTAGKLAVVTRPHNPKSAEWVYIRVNGLSAEYIAEVHEIEHAEKDTP